MYFAVYRKSTGEIVSTGSNVADPLPDGLGVKKLAEEPDFSKRQWNASTLEFEDKADPEAPVPIRMTASFRSTETGKAIERISREIGIPVVEDPEETIELTAEYLGTEEGKAISRLLERQGVKVVMVSI